LSLLWVVLGPKKGAGPHAPNEKTWKADLVRCAAFYAALPLTYLAHKKG
jgi:acetylornithine deacetylase/succinyl-diaminopimelate desuccinylase-like protein